MIPKTMKFLAALLLMVFPASAIAADAVKMKHVLSIYADSKGGGMKNPEGVACGPGSAVIVADTGNGRLLKFSVQDKNLSGGEEIKLPEGVAPIRLQVNAKGEILVLDGRQRRILRLNPDGTFNAIFSPEGLATTTPVIPRSFKLDSADNVYLDDIFSGRIIVTDPAGKFLRQIEFPKDSRFISDLAVDQRGTIFILDSIKSVVYSAGPSDTSFSPLTKDLDKSVTFPVAMSLDAQGVLYLADEHGSGIVVIQRDGTVQGRLLTAGWKEGQLRYPDQICFNGKEEAFVADRENSRVQMFDVLR